MKNLLVLGAGRIGLLVSCELASSNDYNIHLTDKVLPIHDLETIDLPKGITLATLNVKDNEKLSSYITENKIDGVISCLPFNFNKKIATTCKDLSINYFDPTEDVETTKYIESLAKNSKSKFAPQCGLAPGFISIIANHLIKKFDKVHTAALRVGALPLNVTNALQYGLTWSTEGLVNEYLKPCLGLYDGKIKEVDALIHREEIKIDGVTYEAFNTSGGVGSLIESYEGKINTLTYKTIRYPGHLDKIDFLINGMKMKNNFKNLCEIFENAIPKIHDDLVLIYSYVDGIINGQYFEHHFAEKYHSRKLYNYTWSALQLTTATSFCVTIDEVMQGNINTSFVKQEDITLERFLNNRFGYYYKECGSLNFFDSFHIKSQTNKLI